MKGTLGFLAGMLVSAAMVTMFMVGVIAQKIVTENEMKSKEEESMDEAL